MPSFDVVSEIDHQEVRNAVDQAKREITTRYDFKGTESAIDLTTEEITLNSSSEDRLAALRVLLEEKLVKRKVSLKVPAGSQSGRTLRVRGRGVKRKDGRTGDLLVTVELSVPQRLSSAARQALDDYIAATRDHDPRADLTARVERTARRETAS